MTRFRPYKFLIPLYQRLSGRKITSRLIEFERNQWLSTEEIQIIQRRLINNLIKHTYHHAPFYHKILNAVGIAKKGMVETTDWDNIPFLTKDDILTHRDELLADDYAHNTLKINASGGSTGHTLSFYNDRTSLDFRSAVTIRGDRWAGLDIGTPHARLWGAPTDLYLQQRLVNRISNYLQNRLWLDCFHLSESLMESYVQRLRHFHAEVLVGYATALATFSQYLLDHNITDIRPKGIISSAETLYPEQRQQINRALDCKVYNRYGSRETGPIACECQFGHLHVNSDYVFLEIIKNGVPAMPGEIGEIVVTPLYSYGMPLIRYRIGDLGVPSSPEPCPCGRGLPTLDRIIGRTSDMLVNSRGELFHGEYFTHLFYHQPGVRQFQVIQPDRFRLQFKLVIEPDFNQQLTDQLESKIQDFVGPMAISWELVDEIPPLSSGKRAFTISLVSEKDKP